LRAQIAKAEIHLEEVTTGLANSKARIDNAAVGYESCVETIKANREASEGFRHDVSRKLDTTITDLSGRCNQLKLTQSIQQDSVTTLSTQVSTMSNLHEAHSRFMEDKTAELTRLSKCIEQLTVTKQDER
jgi:chromosome segregation ATPase